HAGALRGDQRRMTGVTATWRHDIDALAFRPGGHEGTCMVHRLAFRALMRLVPTPDACIAYFTAHQGTLRLSAQAKIRRQAISPRPPRPPPRRCPAKKYPAPVKSTPPAAGGPTRRPPNPFPSPVAPRRSGTVLQAGLAMALGLFIVFMVGFSPIAAVHNATHD